MLIANKNAWRSITSQVYGFAPLAWLICFALCLTPSMKSRAQTIALPSHIDAKSSSDQKTRPVIGIAFEGGGALGLAHVGVLQWMDEHHVPVDRITGTSMGALVGALSATGSTPKEIEELARSGILNDLFTVQPSLAHLSYRRRQDRTEMPGALSFGLKGGVTIGSGLISDNQLIDRSRPVPMRSFHLA